MTYFVYAFSPPHFTNFAHEPFNLSRSTQQFMKAGFIDELQIHLVPVLFGSGVRLFEHVGSEHIPLETAEVIETAEAIHLRFRVVK